MKEACLLHNHFCGSLKIYRIVVISLVLFFAYFFVMKLEAIYSSEASVHFRLLHSVIFQEIELFTKIVIKENHYAEILNRYVPKVRQGL
jgi:hypothetical protein